MNRKARDGRGLVRQTWHGTANMDPETPLTDPFPDWAALGSVETYEVLFGGKTDEAHCFGCDSPPVSLDFLPLPRVCDLQDLHGRQCMVGLCPVCYAQFAGGDTELLQRLRTRAADTLDASN